MRKRSMSVFVARENNRLSKKFEGVASDNELQSDSENEDLVPECHLEESKEALDVDLSWTKHEYEALVTQLRGTLPKKDIRKWKTSLEAVDWQQIKIGKRPRDEVEKVAKEVINKVRSFRTLSEMLSEVPDVVSKLLCATRPKPPLTAYSLFVKEKLPQLREEHKDLKVQQIFKLIPEQYKALSAKKRRRYEADAAKNKLAYQVQLQKFYDDHPDLSPKKGYKPRKEPLKTPFHLFYQERREISSNISFQQARREWEELPVKDKVVFIQRSFDVQGNTDLKLVNKREMEWLDQSLGKPEFCGRNVYEFYRRKMKSQPGKEQEAKVREDYKHLSEQELEALRVEYNQARNKYVSQYQQYIKKLPKEKQQAEIDFLMTITEKTKTKKAKSEKTSAMADDDHYPDSPEDPPAAESTTIKKKPAVKATTKVAAIKKEHKSDHSDADSVDHSGSPKKKSSRASAVATTPVASVASPSKRKQPVSAAKTEPTSASSSDEREEDGRAPPKRKVTTSAATSPTKNGAKKRTSSEEQTPTVATKKTKVKKEQTEQQPQATPKEPEKPPRDAEEFYRQRIYKGKVGKHKEAYANLSSAKKREVVEQLKAAQKQYIVDFEVFLKSLPKEEIRKYIQQRAKKQQKVEKTDDSDDDDDDDDDEEEDGSSSGEEEEDDE